MNVEYHYDSFPGRRFGHKNFNNQRKPGEKRGQEAGNPPSVLHSVQSKQETRTSEETRSIMEDRKREIWVFQSALRGAENVLGRFGWW